MLKNLQRAVIASHHVFAKLARIACSTYVPKNGRLFLSLECTAGFSKCSNQTCFFLKNQVLWWLFSNHFTLCDSKGFTISVKNKQPPALPSYFQEITAIHVNFQRVILCSLRCSLIAYYRYPKIFRL